jgi:hypothetical protein
MSRESRSDTPFVDFSAGSTILREGEAAAALFIIEAGKVAIERSDAPGFVLAELGPGDFFGEMSILQDQSHSANVVARTAVRALRVDSVAFPAVLRENVDVAIQIMRRLVLRLRELEQRQLAAQAQSARGEAPARVAPSAPAAAAVAAPIAAPIAAPAAAAPAPVAPMAPAPLPAATPSATAVMAPKAAPASVPAPARPAAPAAAPPPRAAPAAKPAATTVFVLRHAEAVITLPEDKAECVIGRPDPATGAIPEINLGPLDKARSLSRRHARLLVAASGVVLREEPGVSNGTWVNGERLAAGQSVALKPGDKLRFGAIDLEFGTA